MELFELLQKVVGLFEHLRIPYLVTGSVAAMAFGEPRLTNDIDIVAEIQDIHIKGLKNCFPENEFHADEDTIRKAICQKFQFNIIHPQKKTPQIPA